MRFACLDLLNSDWSDYRGSGRTEDRLQDPRWVEEFSERWGLQAAGRPDAAVLAVLVSLRALLKQMIVELMAGAPPAPEALAELNSYLTAPVARQLKQVGGDCRLELVPVEPDWQWAVSEIACSFSKLLALDSRRLKICKNGDCGWIFYDESKSRTRCWCDDDCGNLLKVRRFRERQKETQGQGEG